MRLLHFSDVHVGLALKDVPLAAWFGKRALAGLNLMRGRGRRFAAAPMKLEALAEFARDNGVDAVLCTGDYTALGLEEEYRRSRQAVQPLIDARSGFVTVPGNHDLYVPEVVRAQRFERHFGDTLSSDLPEYRVDRFWPTGRLFGESIAVCAVNSARPNPQPWRSSGRIPTPQLVALGKMLGDERLRERFVFILTHYAARMPDGSRDTRLHGLVNADEFLTVCADVPRGAILCGHVHHSYRVKIPGVTPPVFCAGSATLSGREGFWLFDVDRGSARATRGSWGGGGYSLEPDSSIDVS
jgi:hypothetical protein